MASNGVAGEHYVVAELTRRGMVATITGKNTADVDVLAVDPSTGKSIMIQVKETPSLKRNGGGFKFGAKVNKKQIETGVWYVFVDLDDFSCYIIQANELFKITQKRWQDYLDTPLKRKTATGIRKPDTNFYFMPMYDCVAKDGMIRKNNWTDLPLF